jgi:YrbI family 3-deoxy-D-manno-octulosonate 8-phosphate phosphatase
MATVAFIPLRGGSKSIPGKNIKVLAGQPLAWWTVSAAAACQEIDTVYVATDSNDIRKVVEGFQLPKVQVIGRSEQSATDTASTESALIEFAQQHEDADTIILIQATSPLLQTEDLDRGLTIYCDTKADTLLSAVRQKRFNWKVETNGLATPLNYDPLRRPRRQEFDGYLVENGAFYIMKRTGLLQSGCRLHGKISLCEMPEETYCELDEPSDWAFIENFLQHRKPIRQSKRIRMFVTDVDGVLTDAGMYYTENGDELKKFNTRDGMGMRLLQESGVVVGIITSENTKMVERRAKKLQVDFLHQGAKRKLPILQQECQARGIDLSEVAYIGDDVNDLECIQAVGWSACPADAVEEIKRAAHEILNTRGGMGAVREFVNVIVHNTI